MMYFVDFETQGLEGTVIDCAFISLDAQSFYRSNNLKDLFNHMSEDKTIVFWHNWMIRYLSSVEPELFESLKGNNYTFVDAYVLYNNLNGSKSISGITKELLNKEHKGNAKDDVEDLRECYIKFQNLYKSDLR